MAKSKPRAPNTRAARRAASPSLDVDRSLINAPRMDSSPEPRSALADRAGAGIQKKQKQTKRMSRAQRMRQQKGMDRAEAVLDQLEIKKDRSLNRAKNVKARRGDWEDLNKKASAFAALQKGGAEDDEDEEDDDAMATEATPAARPNPFVSESTDMTVEDAAPSGEEEEEEL